MNRNLPWSSKAACQGLDPDIFYPLHRGRHRGRAGQGGLRCLPGPGVLPRAHARRSGRRTASGAGRPNANGAVSSASAAARPDRSARPRAGRPVDPPIEEPVVTNRSERSRPGRPRRLAGDARPPHRRAGPHRRAAGAAMTRDPRRGGHRRPDRRVHRGPAHEGRDRRRGVRHGRRHARPPPPRSPCREAPRRRRHRRHRRRARPGGPRPQRVDHGHASSPPAPGPRSCKHGNRGPRPPRGSSDLLEALGVAIELDGAGVARCVAEAGVGLLLRPHLPPGHAPRRPGARRARRADGVQLPRARCRTRPGCSARSSA